MSLFGRNALGPANDIDGEWVAQIRHDHAQGKGAALLQTPGNDVGAVAELGGGPADALPGSGRDARRRVSAQDE